MHSIECVGGEGGEGGEGGIAKSERASERTAAKGAAEV